MNSHQETPLEALMTVIVVALCCIGFIVCFVQPFVKAQPIDCRVVISSDSFETHEVIGRGEAEI